MTVNKLVNKKFCCSLLLALIVFSYSSYGQIESKESTNEIYSRLGKAPRNGGFKMEGYWVWGSSVIKGEEGKYHMFASRWPKSMSFHPGWMINSEIVRASSTTPEGPYQFEEVVFKKRGPQYWDGQSTHNPRILKHKDTYVLFYMGSTHPFEDFPESDTLKLNSKYSIIGRSNERIGIATSKSVSGPWVRKDAPIIDVKPDTYYSFLTSNPSPIMHKDGSVTLIFKSRGHNSKFPYHGHMNIGLAKAKHYNEDYKVVTNTPLFSDTNFGIVEDPFIWEDHEGYKMIAKDHVGSISKVKGGVGIISYSKDAINWNVKKSPIAYTKNIVWDDGETQKLGQMERPFILFENGKATHIFFAVMDGPGGFGNATKSWNMVIPLTSN